MKIWQIYFIEAKYESLRMLRAPGFAIPFLLLPVFLFLLFGVVMFGEQAQKDPGLGRFLFTAFAVFGVMGPGMFAFGATVANEREHGLLTLKRALPAPPGAYLLAKMAMAMVFSSLVMGTLIGVAVSIGHVSLTAAQCLGITAITVVGGLPFCAIGLFIGTRVTGKSAPAVVNLIYVPMMHVSGLFYPLPKFMQQLAPIWPSYHLQQLVLSAAGSKATGASLSHAAVLAGITVVLGVFAVRRLSRVG